MFTKHISRQLAALIDGELTAPAAEQAEIHAAQCAQCRAEREQVRFGMEILRGIPRVEAPDSIKVHTRRIEQAAAGGIRYIITFGKISAGAYETWIRNLKELGPIAKSAGVTIVIKQHGGNTGTGQACAKILSEVADEGVKLCYDAGNVLDYEKLDPIPDIQTCWRDIRAFAIKDHRITPKNQDCGPGFGEIDHYKLLAPVLRTSLTIPLVCENIFAPLVPRPPAPEGVDILASRAREYMEVVIRGLQTV